MCGWDFKVKRDLPKYFLWGGRHFSPGKLLGQRPALAKKKSSSPLLKEVASSLKESHEFIFRDEDNGPLPLPGM